MEKENGDYVIEKLPSWWKYRHSAPALLRRLPSVVTSAMRLDYGDIEKALDKSGDRTIKHISDLEKKS